MVANLTLSIAVLTAGFFAYSPDFRMIMQFVYTSIFFTSRTQLVLIISLLVIRFVKFCLSFKKIPVGRDST